MHKITESISIFLHTYSVLFHDYVNLIRDVLLLPIARVLDNSKNQPQNVKVTTYGQKLIQQLER